MDQFDWFVGIDWATTAHQVCIIDAAANDHGQQSFAHSGQGLAEMAAWLLDRTAADSESIAVAIEVPHGAVVESLLLAGFAVFSINTRQSDRFRDRISPAGAKDDRRDARVLADALRTDQSSFRRLELPDPLVTELRDLTRIVEDLTRQQTRLKLRLRGQLNRYYPQFAQLSDNLTEHWLLELWRMAPSPAKAQTLSKARVARVLKRNRIRRIDAATVLTTLRQPKLHVAPGTTEGATRRISVMVEQILLAKHQLSDANSQLDETIEALAASESETSGGRRDVAILQSLPGVGRMVLATLLAEAHELLHRRDYRALRCFSGNAPVTKRSGKAMMVVRRRAYHHRLSQAVWHWSRIAIQHDPVSRRKYDALRERGHSHARSLRTVGDRLLAVACAMLESQTFYDADHRQKGSANAT